MCNNKVNNDKDALHVGDNVTCIHSFFNNKPVNGVIKAIGNEKATVMFHKPIMHFVLPVTSLTKNK